MEDQHYKIDETFQQRLHDAEVPPPPFVWPAVERQLSERRRRRPFWMLVSGIAAASAAMLLLWIFMDKATGEAGAQSPTAEEKSSVSPQTETLSLQSQEEFVRANNQEVTDEAADSEIGLSPRLFSGKSTQASSGAGNSKISAKGHKEKGVAATATETMTKIDNAEGIGSRRDVAGGNKDFPATQSEVKSKIFSSSLLPPSSRIVAVKHAGNQPVLALKTYKSPTRKKREHPQFCYDFTKHPNAWLVDVYAGPSLAQRTLTSQPDDEPYLNQRLSTERQSTAMNAGLRASLMFNRNFLVRTGLNYDQITEVFEYIDPTYVKYLIEVTVVGGQTVIDTVGVEYGENYQKKYNRYAMLDIPLMVGLEMRKGRSGISINAGASANILFQKSGAIIDPVTHEPATFGPEATLSQDVFRANVGLSAVASVQWYWHLTSRLRVFAEPSFKQILRPISLDGHPVEHRYGILGLRLGATRIF